MSHLDPKFKLYMAKFYSAVRFGAVAIADIEIG